MEQSHPLAQAPWNCGWPETPRQNCSDHLGCGNRKCNCQEFMVQTSPKDFRIIYSRGSSQAQDVRSLSRHLWQSPKGYPGPSIPIHLGPKTKTYLDICLDYACSKNGLQQLFSYLSATIILIQRAGPTSVRYVAFPERRVNPIQITWEGKENGTRFETKIALSFLLRVLYRDWWASKIEHIESMSPSL